jgi:hypothetical protein
MENLLENLQIDFRIILKWILKEYDLTLWTDLIWLWIGSSVDLL